jgi:hypothetical protein
MQAPNQENNSNILNITACDMLKLHLFLYFGFQDSCRSPPRRRYGTSILLQVMVQKLLDQPRDSPSRKKLAGKLGHLTVTIYRKTETEVPCDEVGATTPSRVWIIATPVPPNRRFHISSHPSTEMQPPKGTHAELRRSWH